MCFTDKRKMNWIRKEDRLPDLICVGYEGVSHHKHQNNSMKILTTLSPHMDLKSMNMTSVSISRIQKMDMSLYVYT